jgi:transposase
MSLQPQEVPPVPNETRRIARAAFPKGNVYTACAMPLAPSIMTSSLRRWFRRVGNLPHHLGVWP